jgi:Cu2+-exporting ATPase
VPASFAGALLTAILTRDSAKVASVLMVDYSCAIRLSTPLSILSAMRSGVDAGILIKGGKFLEALALADTVVFDKTGTLTKASPQVADIISFGKYSSMEILRLAACLEEHFPHPLGRAVVRYANQHHLRHREEHAQVEYIAAHGIVSRLHGDKVLLGSAHFMADEGIVPTAAVCAGIEQQAGRSLLYLAVNQDIIGVLALEDPVRSDAAALIKSLRKDGVDVHMLTGDGPETAKACAALLGIEHYQARMLPEDKAAYIQRLKDEGRHIIMAGDGINDSPALALADVGVTLQDGSELARNVADVVLTRNNISDLELARSLGKQTLRRIHHNYVAIVSINTLLLLLGVTGVITPAGSALLHNSSTVLSALNGMRSFKKSILQRN